MPQIPGGECTISRIGLPPSDQSEWLWQSPRRAAQSASPAATSGASSASSLAR